MITPEERLKVLEMLKEGKISPEAAARLLDAMGSGAADPVQPADSPEPPEPGRKPRWLRVRVTDVDTGRPRVNVRMPVSLVNLGLKLGSRFAPEIEGLDIGELLRAAELEEPGPFVDVIDEEDGEHVEVFLE